MTRAAAAVAPIAVSKNAPSRSSGLVLQRKCACGGAAGFSGQCEECGKKRLSLQRRTAGSATGLAPPIVHQVLRSPGQPLDPATRALMEPRFGHDFSRVRVHTDARAAQSADAVNALAYTVDRDVVFGAGRYAPHTDDGRHLLYHELTHVVQQRGGAIKGLQRANGPQSPANKKSGPETIDPKLKAENKTLEHEILGVAEAYYHDKDLRWLFAYAHGKITQQINDNLTAFEQPNELIRLNLHFGRAFLRAAQGKPSKAWKVAFLACSGLEAASWVEPKLVGETELCGAAMAKVHIDVDLSNALQELGCISPTDYGNMLLFVERGSFAALVRLRGETLAKAEDTLQKEVAPVLGLDVKAWRNAAYQKICNIAVPDVEPGFSKRVVQRVPTGTGAPSALATSRHQDYETPGGEASSTEQLRIGAPDDHFEREAEHMAAAMVRQPAPEYSVMTRAAVDVAPVAVSQKAPGKSSGLVLQRKCACGGGSAGLSGECEECGKKRLGIQRRAAGPATGLAPPIVHEVLRSPGQPLDPATRAFMEPRFGHDFSRVRVHADGRAARSADTVSALAYTVGQDVVFASGQYAPGTNEGRNLLAHELMHVMQQDAIAGFRSAGEALTIGDPDNSAEREADHVSGQAKADLSTYARASSRYFDFGPSRNLLAQDRSHVLRRMKQRKPPTSDVKSSDLKTNELDHGGPSPNATQTGLSSRAAAENVSKQVCEPDRPLTWQDFQIKPSEGLTVDKEKGQLTETQAETACGLVPTYNGELVPMTLSAKFWPEQSWVLNIYKSPTDPFENGLIESIGYCKESFAGGSKGPYSFMISSCTKSPWPEAKTPQDCESKEVMNRYAQIQQERSREVLKHEQGHFDITCAMAKNGSAALSSFSADDITSRQNCLAKYQERETALQRSYDSEAGVAFANCEAQERWNKKLEAGLREERNLCR